MRLTPSSTALLTLAHLHATLTKPMSRHVKGMKQVHNVYHNNIIHTFQTIKRLIVGISSEPQSYSHNLTEADWAHKPDR